MISILAHVILIPDRDLVCEIIFSRVLNRSPLHLSKISIGAFVIQIQHRLPTRQVDLRIKGAPLLESIQLPDA
jgi:hypothetical protein